MSEPTKYPVEMRNAAGDVRSAADPTEFHQARYAGFKVVVAKSAKAADKS
jgi:hypothetical protein